MLADILKCVFKLVLSSNLISLEHSPKISTVSAMAKSAMFPLQAYITHHATSSTFFEPLAVDAAYLHALGFVTQAYFSLLSSNVTASADSKASIHLSKGLRLLRERLSVGDDAAMVSDSTIMVVLSFTVHALIMGDYDAAGRHIKGLHKIVGLRGGVEAFRDQVMTLGEIIRYVSGYKMPGT
jgi:hypothetical protein